jgi:hypothetical protein
MSGRKGTYLFIRYVPVSYYNKSHMYSHWLGVADARDASPPGLTAITSLTAAGVDSQQSRSWTCLCPFYKAVLRELLHCLALLQRAVGSHMLVDNRSITPRGRSAHPRTRATRL